MTLWTVFMDVSFMAVLLIVGQILRAKVKLFQKFLIPPALIGGFLALLLGPNGYKVIPFSSSLGTYAGILIVLIFAAMPIGDKPTKAQLSNEAIGGMFFNITGIAVLQYAVGMLLTVYLISIFYDVNPGFGLMMATGFYGRHGTAAAVGSMYANLGWAEATDLAMTTATVGIVGGIIIGVIIINWGTRKGYTHYVTDPKDLPRDMRTGLIAPENQKPGGKVTVSSICLDPAAFHISIVLIPSLLGYLTSKYIKSVCPVAVPAFCLAVFWGFVMQFILKKTKAINYVDKHSITRISGTATDFLMISGIGSVKIFMVIKYALPLLIICLAGFLVTWAWFLLIGTKSSPENWFERNMMVWGHATGVVATGVLLLRIVDPDLRSRGIEDTGIVDLFNRPIIIGLQVLPPMFLVSLGAAGEHVVTWALVASVVVLFIIAYVLKWWRPDRPLKKYR